MKYILSLIGFFFVITGRAQLIKGSVTDTDNNPVSEATVLELSAGSGTVTDDEGQFVLRLKDQSPPVRLLVSHISYEDYILVIDQWQPTYRITLTPKTAVLKTVSVTGTAEDEEPGIVKLNPRDAELLPTPFGEFNKILTTLPGVVSNNELSSVYSVRGGNFDENLVYVNDIPVYRPFLVTNGQQEGLSFINSNLVSAVSFSAGGWQARYGDKLSSVLNVTYKDPDAFGASASLSLLGGAVHAEGSGMNGRMSYAAGIRHKSSQYLLNTLEVEGQYLPRFTDYQSIININLGAANDPKRTQLSMLASYARNRYFTEPASRETEFGNFNRSLRLFVAFEGQETLEYDTYQLGYKWSHRISPKWKTQLVAAGVYAGEREYTEVEGAYRLCDVDKDLSSANFNECVFTRGIGTHYDYGRNNLTARILNVENRHIVLAGENTVEVGISYSKQVIEDRLQEYTFTDSVDYVIERDAVRSQADLRADEVAGFAQVTLPLSDQLTTTLGMRAHYRSLNGQWLISPRGEVAYTPLKVPQVSLSAAVGLYRQPPFFREMRDFNGAINTGLKAQSAIHFIAGANYRFTWWSRPFVLDTDLYYKRLYNVVPYEVENVKIRYYALNNTRAYAAGVDVRVSGEFIEGAESWFSLGLLNVRENVAGDGRGYIRRPTDQRVNVAVFFQDHIPNKPDIRVKLNLLYGSGLPFGPPQSVENRNSYNGGAYTRVDIGFSRVLYFNKAKYSGKRNLTLSAEVLNLLGADNPISYTWISDVNNSQFAVPNALSARFLNLRAAVRF